jgi:hypothetical protein
MPVFSLTDSLGNPVAISAVNWTSASSLSNYLKSELLHLTVAPDFIQLKDKALSDAAPQPVSFEFSVKQGFQLGHTVPEIDLTPAGKVALFVNATPGSGLLDSDSFLLPAIVPEKTGYVGVSFQGSLDLGVSGSSGDLSFGIDSNRGITLEFVKAFATDANKPSLGDATAAMFSGFVIPARVEDLKNLNPGDICCVSGEGSLQISGSVDVAVPVNPLASVNLPLGFGTISVTEGAMAGLSASLTLSGSYQIRVQKLNGNVVRLSYLRDRAAAFTVDLAASAGVSVTRKSKDLLTKLLGAIGKGVVDQKLLDGLTPDELDTFTTALKAGADHSLKASLDMVLSESADKQAAFQYDIQIDQLDLASTNAVNRALRGDLSVLTSVEETAGTDGTLAAGIKLRNSVFSTARDRGFSVKVNLFGIVNLISSSDLIGKCEFLFEPASGDLTIKETAASDRIGGITDPFRRQEALCKAIFDSVLVTTTYVVSKAVSMPSLSCEAVHFTANRNTSNQTIADYTNWFVVLNLMKAAERTALLGHGGSKGMSTCVVRAPLDDAACEALFFDGQGNLRDKTEYLEIGRQALKSLLDPAGSPVDQFRFNFLDNDVTWQKAVEMGPSGQLRELIPLSSTDTRLAVILGDVSGDLYDIVWWANSMQNAGQALHDMRAFLAGRDPSTLRDSSEFATRRNALQKLMLGVVSASKVRFNEPWGMVCLYRAAGSRQSSGKIAASTLAMQRDALPVAVSGAGQ